MSSNVEIMKTKAEEAFAEQFAAVVDALPGNAAQLGVRKAAMARFDELGLPHRRIEAWKYTDLRNVLGAVGTPVIESQTYGAEALRDALGPLENIDCYRIVLVNQYWDRHGSSIPDGVRVDLTDDLGPDLSDADDMLKDETIVALNAAFAMHRLCIEVEAGVVVDKPLMILSIRSGREDFLLTPRYDVLLNSQSQLTLIDANVSINKSGGQTNGLTTVTVGEGARLDHIKAGSQAPITDLATWRVRLGAEARYHAFQLVPGAPLARNQVFVTFDGAGGEMDFATVALGNGTDHIDSTIVVDHAAPGCTSRELFKGVLDDRARGVSQGKVIVQRQAQKTDGKQMAQALMLSEDAEFDSKPELEIYADDVACGHGSTSAEIDPDLVFYCRSRGIPEDQAKVLLTESFVAEAIDKVEHEALREAMGEIARTWLAANHAR